MQSTTTQPQLSLSPTVAYDSTTDTYAAWCDQLAVATSAPTEQEAKAALVDAMRVAAEYVLSHLRSASAHMFAYAPYAEAVASRGDEELTALIDVNP